MDDDPDALIERLHRKIEEVSRERDAWQRQHKGTEAVLEQERRLREKAEAEAFLYKDERDELRAELANIEAGGPYTPAVKQAIRNSCMTQADRAGKTQDQVFEEMKKHD